MPVVTPANPSLYRGHRYPADVIANAVWLYFRFSLSLRDVEELMAERGVTVTYETIREWAAQIRTGLRPPVASSTSSPERQMAFG